MIRFVATACILICFLSEACHYTGTDTIDARVPDGTQEEDSSGQEDDALPNGESDVADSSDQADDGRVELIIVDERLGDPSLSYWNPEFTPDGRYMIWFEPTSAPMPDGRVYGKIWHCAIDPDTGNMVPSDGRGFYAFPSTVWTRANAGADRDGAYYVGQYASENQDPNNGKLVHVRPTGPTTGVVTVITESLAKERRRSIFPTTLQERGQNEQFIWWLENDTGYTPSAAEEVELRFISLAEPAVEYVITKQQAPGPKWSPMDTTYVRLVKGTSFLTLGVPVGTNIEVATFDLTSPTDGLTQVTQDGRHKLDPYSFGYQGQWYFIAGVNGTDESVLYRASSLREQFLPVETIVPAGDSEIASQDRCQPQSHEIFIFRGRLWSAFQIADCSSGSNFLTRRGEIWLTSWFESPAITMRISHNGPEANNEPEPVVGKDRVWIFYTAYPAGQSPLSVQYELRRITIQ